MDSILHLLPVLEILLMILCAVSSSKSDMEDVLMDEGYPGNVTEPTLIRRRPSPRAVVAGGNRFALMNSRFNRRPRKKNLDPEHLMEILGDYFDPDWMSIEKPADLSKEDGGTSYVVRPDAWQYQELSKILHNSNLSSELAQLGGEKFSQSPFFVSVVEKWLMRKASCPVRYAWEDIGAMFWPRWIKRGECASVPGTCSWPPGMHCVPTGTSTLHILRWQCRQPKGKGRRKQSKMVLRKGWDKKMEAEQQIFLKCSWIRVPYPITSECLCTC